MGLTYSLLLQFTTKIFPTTFDETLCKFDLFGLYSSLHIEDSLTYMGSDHRQVIDRYLTDFSHASSYRKILRAMRILCGNQNAMVIAFCRFCNIIKLQFLYYFKNNVSRAKKLWILMVLILYRNVKSNLHNAPKCLQVSQLQNVNKNL